MLFGIKVLASSVILSGYFIPTLPVMVLTISGILCLKYGGQNRQYAWLLIAGSLAYAIMSSVIFIAPISLISFAVALIAVRIGYAMLTTGRLKLQLLP
ncbi:FHA domain-containing protein [Calothrix sp. NIES-2098]|nr:FHA domain-containing protein [Calothrix sp. NIES-2098]